MEQASVKIAYNKKISTEYSLCGIVAPRIASQAKPGQFLNIRINDTLEPLLRRPLSIHRVHGSIIELLFEVVGKGSKILSERKAGEILDVIGPLGNGFDCSILTTPHSIPILIAGGMGVAPLVFLAEKLQGVTRSPGHQVASAVLIGAQTKKKILCAKEFKKLGCEVKIATDDGSQGFKGKVTDLLMSLLSTIDYRLSTIYACGPRPMLKAISRIATENNFSAQISLEEHMSCGVGACLGCAVNTRTGYQRVCAEGPVFDAGTIIWE